MVVNFKVLTWAIEHLALETSALESRPRPDQGRKEQGDHERIACSQPVWSVPPCATRLVWDREVDWKPGQARSVDRIPVRFDHVRDKGQKKRSQRVKAAQ